MDDREAKLGRLQRMVVQQLESLHRCGVGQLIRRAPQQSISRAPRSPVTSGPAPIPQDPAPVSLSTVSRARIDPPHVPSSVPRAAADVSDSEREMAKRSLSDLEQRELGLAEIRREVAACRRCEHLACARTQTVFGVGAAKPRLCFMGEAPGADEDRQGEPFVGRAGQLLTDMIERGMGLRRSDVYILNVLKCRPPDNRTPTDEEIANCRGYFERQLEILKPEFICCLGATAVKALLHRSQPLGRMRGQWFDYQGARVIITYHPSYLLRNPAAKKDTWADLQILMGEMGLPLPARGG